MILFWVKFLEDVLVDEDGLETEIPDEHHFKGDA